MASKYNELEARIKEGCVIVLGKGSHGTPVYAQLIAPDSRNGIPSAFELEWINAAYGQDYRSALCSLNKCVKEDSEPAYFNVFGTKDFEKNNLIDSLISAGTRIVIKDTNNLVEISVEYNRNCEFADWFKYSLASALKEFEFDKLIRARFGYFAIKRS